MDTITLVLLQYPISFSDSPYYKYLTSNISKKIDYLNNKVTNGVLTSPLKVKSFRAIKQGIRNFLDNLNIGIINSRKTPFNSFTEDCDVIHCCHCLSKNDDFWVADFESVWQLSIGPLSRINRKKIKDMILSPKCLKIITWTENTKKDFLRVLPEIKDKLEVVYPALPLRVEKKKIKKKNEKIRILYASRNFNLKGGELALNIFKTINSLYGDQVELTFISDKSPSKIREEHYINDSIKLMDLVSEEELHKIYKNTDIFFYPSFVDTFGFAILEAMSYGIPTIAVKAEGTKAVEELIKNDKTGFIVKNSHDIFSRLEEKLSSLIEDKKKLSEMGNNCIEEIKNGKFSINKRNKKMERIYKWR